MAKASTASKKADGKMPGGEGKALDARRDGSGVAPYAVSSIHERFLPWQFCPTLLPLTTREHCGAADYRPRVRRKRVTCMRLRATATYPPAPPLFAGSHPH